MPKATKVISGTSNGPSTTLYTVPTGKVARIEILLGTGVKTSDGSIDNCTVNPNFFSYVRVDGPNQFTLPIPVNYTLYRGSDIGQAYFVRNVTYLKAGGYVQASIGSYSILVVEEDAG